MAELERFQRELLTETEIDAVLDALRLRYRLIRDSMGLLGLYVEMGPEEGPEDCARRFWEKRDEFMRAGRRFDGVARPFDPDSIYFLTSSAIDEDYYLKQLFCPGADELKCMPPPHLRHWLEPGQLKTASPGRAKRVVFYSYKGGVGRTTGLLLTAWVLANRGKQVALVDFDLEAPGLAAITLWPSEMPQKGVVDYLVERPVLSALDAENRKYRLGNEYLQKVSLEVGGNGRIHILPAGRVDSLYAEKLAYASIEHIERLPANPLDQLFTHLEEALPEVELILIDSRTGIADIGGSLLFKYADVICAFYYDNSQNLEGMALLDQYRQRIPQGRHSPELFWVKTLIHRESERRSGLTAADTVAKHPWVPDKCLTVEYHDELKRIDRWVLENERPHRVPNVLQDYERLADQILGLTPKSS